MTDRDDRFEESVRDVLRASEHDIDADSLAQLAQARRNAVALADHTAGAAVGRWLPVSALAATVLTVGLGYQMVRAPDAPATMLDNEQVWLAAEDMELLENLEFLAWMEAQARPDNAG